jgi:hypothetical protein
MKNDFNFSPLRRFKKQNEEIYLKINKNGYIYFSKKALSNFGLSNEGDKTFIKIYYDKENRAMGFRFNNNMKLGEKDPSVRLLVVHKNKAGVVFATISIKELIDYIGDTELPTDRLLIQKYKGSYLTEELYYVIINKKRKCQKKQ